MSYAQTVLVGRDHALGETLDQIAATLMEKGVRVIRTPYGKDGQHSQISTGESDAFLTDVEVIVVSSRTHIDIQVIEQARQLKGVVFPSIGFNSCDISAAAEYGVLVVNGVTAENYEGMAESVVMLMSALTLELNKKQHWLKVGKPNPPGSEFTSRLIRGKTVGLVGFGRIAKEVIKRLQGWGVERFLIYTRTPQETHQQNIEFCTLDLLLEESDIISIHCPLNAATHNLIDVEEFSKMKNKAVLINTSRGGIVNEKALYSALSNQKISAAAIDTFQYEPLDKASPLRSLDNIYLTQHNIGHTMELFESLVPKAVSNVFKLLSGGVPENVVNLKQLKIK